MYGALSEPRGRVDKNIKDIRSLAIFILKINICLGFNQITNFIETAIVTSNHQGSVAELKSRREGEANSMIG